MQFNLVFPLTAGGVSRFTTEHGTPTGTQSEH